MENPPPPANAASSIFSSYFLIIVATVILLIIAATLLLSSCRCLLMESLSHSFRSWRPKKEPKDVGMIPVCRYREEQSFSTECSVCLTAFHEGEKVKQLPACRHSFHAPCVDMWLCSHSSCPSCRALVPQISSGRQRAAAGVDSRQQQVEEREAVLAVVSAV